MQNGGASCSESPSRIPKTGVLTALFLLHCFSDCVVTLFDLLFGWVFCIAFDETGIKRGEKTSRNKRKKKAGKKQREKKEDNVRLMKKKVLQKKKRFRCEIHSNKRKQDRSLKKESRTVKVSRGHTVRQRWTAQFVLLVSWNCLNCEKTKTERCTLAHRTGITWAPTFSPLLSLFFFFGKKKKSRSS